MRKLLPKRSLAALVFVAIGAPAGAAVLMGTVASELGPDAPGVPAVTRERIVALTGSEPERCVYSTPDLELCTWHLEGQLLSSGPPNALPGVNLVCEVPVASAGDAVGSCSAHARGIEDPDAGLPHVSSRPPHMPDMLGLSASQLAQARTVTQLSQLAGDAPDTCRLGIRNQTCSWTIHDDAVNFMLFAALAPGEGMVELRCVLPVDGGRRVANSCDVRPIPSDR
jgi:hypothetical protein